MGRTKWRREKKIIFLPDPGGVLHLPPAVILFLEPNLWGGSRAPGLVSRCVLLLGALGRWCSPGSAGFPVLNWGGLPSLGLWVPNLWASWPGQFRGLLWRGAWIHIVECCSDWATFCWNCNNRLCGPHSRDSWEIILKHQRLINKLNSTGTFRRELQASFFETPFQEILPKIIQKQGFLCSFWSFLQD